MLNFGELVKSTKARHSGERRSPEPLENTCMKLHSIGQDYQDSFGLLKQYLSF